MPGLTIMNAKQHQLGFTLLELMSVVSIIGILAAMAIPRYQDYVNRARVSEAFSLAQPIQEAIRSYYAHTGRFPKSNLAAGLIDAKHISGSNVTAVEVKDGAVHVTIKLREQTGVLSLRPELVAANPPPEIMGWVCGYADVTPGMQAYGDNRTNIEPQLLPTICQI
jgi:type IV pilus assembly protein PilA